MKELSNDDQINSYCFCFFIYVKFPKSDLMNGYIGDKVPLCVDLPTKHYLRKGATFKLIGSRSTPELHNDFPGWEEKYPELLRLEVGSSSPLFAALCAADSGGSCTFPSKIVLDENLVDDDLNVDTIRSVKLQAGLSHPVHYEYVRQPCVEHAFYNDAKKVGKGGVDARKPSPQVIEGSMCADTRLPSATPMCTSPTWATRVSWGMIYCNYHAERVTFSSAEAICKGVEGVRYLLLLIASNQFCSPNSLHFIASSERKADLVQGQPGALGDTRAGPCGVGVSNSIPLFRWWTSVGCEVKVKVAPRSGQVAIVVSMKVLAVTDFVDCESSNAFWTHCFTRSSCSMNPNQILQA